MMDWSHFVAPVNDVNPLDIKKIEQIRIDRNRLRDPFNPDLI